MNMNATCKITEEEYDRERARLRELYGDSNAEAVAKRDQALAVFFYRSGWTQEHLAKKEGKSQKWVDFRLRFGRFLSTMVLNPETAPNNLTERRFRGYWEQTEKDGNERKRFARVQEFMAAELSLQAKRRPTIKKDIVEKFGDGKWHLQSDIAEEIGADEEQVVSTLKEACDRANVSDIVCEKKKVGQELSFRIFKKEKMVSAIELAEKLTPIVKELIAEGKKNMATMSPATVAHLAGLLRSLLDEWTE